MRILCKWHDYYDSVMKEGQDRTLIFKRETVRYAREDMINLSRHLNPQPLVMPRNMESFLLDRRMNFHHEMGPTLRAASIGVLVVAGVKYPFGRISGGVHNTVVGKPEYHYELESFIESMYAIMKEKKPTLGYPWEHKSNERRLQAHFSQKGSRELIAITTEMNLPMLACGIDQVIVNPVLKDYDFMKVMDPWQTYQEISMFLGNIASRDDTPVKISDKDRVAQHGFDKWSFRKMPEGMEKMLPEGVEPKPPKKYLKRADHHWLDVYTSDGHFMDIRVLQWAPGAQRWCYSGNVGTGMYVDTKFWRYVDHCPMPELKEKI